MTSCAAEHATCTAAAGNSRQETCNCLDEYAGCFASAGCSRGSAAAVVQATLEAECPTQCTPTSDGCDAAELEECVLEWQDCEGGAGSDPGAKCGCYADYLRCHASSGCRRDEAWAIAVDECQSS